MDVFISREASAQIKALKALGPAPLSWGLLVGHKRARRFFVEALFPASGTARLPSPEKLDELDRLFGRRVIGVFAVRPDAALTKSVVGPYFYGRLFLKLRFTKKGQAVRPFVIEYGRAFVLAPVDLVTGPKGGAS